MKLYTVGYQGFEIDEFVPFLARKKIRRVIDTRKNPVSRKRGFSKHKLAAALAEKKIEYIHLPGLGTPTEWRKQEQRHEITREELFRQYVRKVLPAAKEELSLVRAMLRETPSVLLCYEADVHDCHRHFVAERLKKLEKGELEVVNLQRDQPKSLGLLADALR